MKFYQNGLIVQRNSDLIQNMTILWAPYRCGMARSQVVDADGLQVWIYYTNNSVEQKRAGSPPSGLGRGLEVPHRVCSHVRIYYWLALWTRWLGVQMVLRNVVSLFWLVLSSVDFVCVSHWGQEKYSLKARIWKLRIRQTYLYKCVYTIIPTL
jgi:hypothetical protein